jgi:hypothetical protein
LSCNWARLSLILSKSLLSSSPLFLISFTSPPYKSCNFFMDILETTIFICPNAFTCSCKSPTEKSNAFVSICRILCHSVTCVRVNCTLFGSLLGLVDNYSMDLCSFVRFLSSSIC